MARNSHRSATKLIHHRSGGDGNLEGNLSIMVGLDQRGGHGAVFRRLRILHKIDQLGSTSFPNPLSSGGLVFEMFADQKQFLVQAGNELLGKNANKLSGEKSGGVLPLLWAEDSVKALDRFGRAAAVQGGKDEVACLGGLQSGAGGHRIPNLSQKNDIGALTQGAPEAFGKGRGISSHFTLSKAAEVFLKKILHRVFDGDDVAGGGLIEPLQTCGHGGGFSCPGRSGHEDEAGGTGKPLLQKGHGQTQILHGWDLSFDVAENGSTDAELAMKVDAEA